MFRHKKHLLEDMPPTPAQHAGCDENTMLILYGGRIYRVKRQRVMFLIKLDRNLQTKNTLTLPVHSSVREDYRGSQFL